MEGILTLTFYGPGLDMSGKCIGFPGKNNKMIQNSFMTIIGVFKSFLLDWPIGENREVSH